MTSQITDCGGEVNQTLGTRNSILSRVDLGDAFKDGTQFLQGPLSPEVQAPPPAGLCYFQGPVEAGNAGTGKPWVGFSALSLCSELTQSVGTRHRIRPLSEYLHCLSSGMLQPLRENRA